MSNEEVKLRCLQLGLDYANYAERSGSRHMMTRDDIVKVAECFYNFAKEEEPTDNKYELMWEELWAVIAPPNSPCCEMDGAKIYQKATDIFHKYFPPMSR